MTQWGAFVGFSGVVVALLLLLARASQSMLSEVESPPTDERNLPNDESPVQRDPFEEATVAESDHVDDASSAEGASASEATASVDGTPARDDAPPAGRSTPAGETSVGETPSEERSAGSSPAEATLADVSSFSAGALLANVLVTHGLFAGLIVGAAVYWAVPASALGVAVPSIGTVAWGIAAGVALYVGNELGAAAAARVGVDHDERLRELLAPSSPGGWVLLLGGALPVIAVAEELIFRGVLVGAFAAGFDLPVPVLVAASSVAFALGHGAQGRSGILVTGVLGAVLAAMFVASGSLALVIVAHYVVNALEFVVHEGFGVEWVGG